MVGSSLLSAAPGFEVDLTAGIDPQLSYWLRGETTSRSSFRWQVSVNGGLTWADVPGTVVGSSTFDWTRVQISLASWVGQTIRLRFQTSNDGYNHGVQCAIDDIGIGEPEPGTPVLLSPLGGAQVSVLRPTLNIRNAVDAQGDELTYEFEVYSDETLTNRVANVPALASGTATTSWQVDLDLDDKLQYWWRCRADDGTDVGPWSETGSFTVNHVNQPPAVVEIVGPPRASILHNLTYELAWKSSTDPDLNDAISAYHIQIADNPDFLNPVVDDASISAEEANVILKPLSRFAGSGGLQSGTVYYWRLRAADLFGAWSDWTGGNWNFEYGTPPFAMDASMDNGAIHLHWDAYGAKVQLEASPTLTEPDWQPVGEPSWDADMEIGISGGGPIGFLRLKVVE
jgi:hypothetical protein